jgi:hypothetical protein
MVFLHCDFASENLRIQPGNVWFGLHDYDVMFFCILQGCCIVILLLKI